MNSQKSNITPGRISTDLAGLPIKTPSEVEIIHLETALRATFINYSVRRDDLIRAVQQAALRSGDDEDIASQKLDMPLPTPIVAGTAAHITVVHNLATAKEMLKVPSDDYRVLLLVRD